MSFLEFNVRLFEEPNLLEGPFLAKSASDKTDKWPFWYVANKNNLNVLRGTGHSAIFTIEPMAKMLATKWNNLIKNKGTNLWKLELSCN